MSKTEYWITHSGAVNSSFSTSIPTRIESTDQLTEALNRYADKKVFILFIGTPEDKFQWCPDCQIAEPIINSALRYLPSDCVFLTVHVGNRSKWTNADNEFRKFGNLNVSSVPTIVDYSQKRLLNLDSNPNMGMIVNFFRGN
ncbi:hypothetical protein FBUS_03508 [Fasciolopsis buskii]|uniref:Thioredoxin domain-containing protein 17 n=1 Tax=Fasciolopsis buskii TaxID=27845 RepID=A0A8E0VNK3_9TREM|nr:hypothetical protein FBUS_03508 [Fasciolopsis buski]